MSVKVPENDNATPEAAKQNPSRGLAEKTKPEKIRVELNVEKWPAMWRPASSKKQPTVRTLERDIELSDGTRGTAKLEIGFTQLGTITTEDQKMFYALIRHWEENGKPADRPVYFSDRLISRLLRKKGWGTNVITAITGSLRRLRTTPLRWIKSYHRKDNAGRQYEEETFFNFLDTLKIVTRKEHGHVTNQQGYFQFDKEILANLLNKYTKPLLDEEFFKLKTEIGQLLYTHVDLILSSKDEKGRLRTMYERKTRDLFFDLGLLQDNPSYRYPSNRKQALLRPISELQGRRLSTGTLKTVAIERTVDGKDYKVIFHKGRTQDQDIAELTEIGVLEPAESLAAGTVVVNHYNQPKDPVALEADELVRYFYQLFFRVDTHQPQPRERAQAASLIAQHGLARAKYVIEFAKQAAEQSKYLPQTFGGIVHYSSRAIAEQEQKAKAQNRTAQITTAKAVPRQHSRKPERGELRLAVLTKEQYQTRVQLAAAELCQLRPSLARLITERADSPIVERSIRAGIIRQLEREPMDLLPLEVIITVQTMVWPTPNLPL